MPIDWKMVKNIERGRLYHGGLIIFLKKKNIDVAKGCVE